LGRTKEREGIVVVSGMCKFDPQSFFKPFIPVMVDDCRGRRLLLERGLLVEYNAFLGMALDSKLEYSLDLTHEHECLGLNFWLFLGDPDAIIVSKRE